MDTLGSSIYFNKNLLKIYSAQSVSVFSAEVQICKCEYDSLHLQAAQVWKQGS